MDNEVAEARARLAAKFGKAQLGGKGRSLLTLTVLAAVALARSLDWLFTLSIPCRYPEKSSEENGSQGRGSRLRRQEAQGSYQEVR